MVKILVFDTETTGLPPFQINETEYPPLNVNGKWERWDDYNFRIKMIREESNSKKMALEQNPELWQQYRETWPYIVQLSYIMFDTDTNNTNVKNVYIEMPPQFTTDEYLSSPNTHPIIKAAIKAGLEAERTDINTTLTDFMEVFRVADIVTGHNIDFDINMLLAECVRTDNNNIFYELIASKGANKFFCTACKATNVVNICYDCKKMPPIFKMPKLNQAYFRMFGYAPNETALHNALIDVVACLRVFYRLWFQGIGFAENTQKVPVCGVGEPDIYLQLKDIDPENEIIKIINSFTPEGIDPAGVGPSRLTICPLIDNDVIKSQMTHRSVKDIKIENEGSSRLGRYKKVTGINPFEKYKKKGGSRNSKNSKKARKPRNSKNSKKSRKSRKSI